MTKTKFIYIFKNINFSKTVLPIRLKQFYCYHNQIPLVLSVYFIEFASWDQKLLIFKEKCDFFFWSEEVYSSKVYLAHSRVPVNGSGLLLELCQVVGVVGQVGEDHPLLVVVLAQDLVVAQEESVADAKPNLKIINLVFLSDQIFRL